MKAIEGSSCFFLLRECGTFSSGVFRIKITRRRSIATRKHGQYNIIWRTKNTYVQFIAGTARSDMLLEAFVVCSLSLLSLLMDTVRAIIFAPTRAATDADAMSRTWARNLFVKSEKRPQQRWDKSARVTFHGRQRSRRHGSVKTRHRRRPAVPQQKRRLDTGPISRQAGTT